MGHPCSARHEGGCEKAWKTIQERLTGGSGGGGFVAKSRPALATPWTVVCQAPLSVGFPRQE